MQLLESCPFGRAAGALALYYPPPESPLVLPLLAAPAPRARLDSARSTMSTDHYSHLHPNPLRSLMPGPPLLSCKLVSGAE